MEDKLELDIILDDATLGWGFLHITRDLSLFPNVLSQEWMPKKHTPEMLQTFWTDVLGCGHHSRPEQVDYALDIVIDRKYIDLHSLNPDPESDSFIPAVFTSDPHASMILADGYLRLQAAQGMYVYIKDVLKDEHLHHVPWLARFYDYGKPFLCFIKPCSCST
jgi:hypothetical protein